MSEHTFRLTLPTVITLFVVVGGALGSFYGMFNSLDKRVTVLEVNDAEREELSKELKETRQELRAVKDELRDTQETQRGLWRDVRDVRDLLTSRNNS